MPMSVHPLSCPMNRRRFLGTSLRWTVAAGMAWAFPQVPAGAAPPELQDLMESAAPARHWVSTASADISCTRCHEINPKEQTYDHGQILIKCELCAQNCMIPEGGRGRCRVRINDRGKLRSLVYGRPVAVHVDPIEKKPFYHFLPGAQAFSLGSTGCPLSCRFCQNWQISQARPEDYRVSFAPAQAVAQGAESHGTPVIAFTYNEPTVFFEYLMDIAQVAREKKIKSVLVSCGFMNSAPLSEMCRSLDAIKIDLKGFSRDFYRQVCGAELEPVLKTLRQIGQSGVHLEIVNLVVPTLNDSDRMLADLSRWIVDELGPDVPVHFTRFHPDYQLRNLPPTPVATLERAYETAKKAGIRYPYVGNVPGHPGNHTYCPACGRKVIERTGFFITAMEIRKGTCRFCGQKIAGVFADT